MSMNLNESEHLFYKKKYFMSVRSSFLHIIPQYTTVNLGYVPSKVSEINETFRVSNRSRNNEQKYLVLQMKTIDFIQP